jgi:mono/diheme cytochrome c family protein
VPVALAAACGGAQAQSNIDAGKSPQQIFADTCSACHNSVRDLKPPRVEFLLKHYTTGAKQASAMATYLAAAINEPPPPKIRRPSESVEETWSPAPGAATASRPFPGTEIEE